MKTRRRFVTDPIGASAMVRVAKHQAFACHGCGQAKPKGTDYVGGTTYWGHRVKTCVPCWLAGQGRAEK